MVDAPALPTEVLVRVKAVGLNPLEARLRAGEFPMLGEPPFVLGWDISGVVEQTQTWRFRPGDPRIGPRGDGLLPIVEWFVHVLDGPIND